MVRPTAVSRPSPNFGYNLLFLPVPGTKGRGGRAVKAIVNHLSESYESGLTSKCLTPGGLSTQFTVMQDRRVVQYVDEGDAAYHIAALNPVERLPWMPPESLGKHLVSVVNQVTIGIEHEAIAGSPPQISSWRPALRSIRIWFRSTVSCPMPFISWGTVSWIACNALSAPARCFLLKPLSRRSRRRSWRQRDLTARQRTYGSRCRAEDHDPTPMTV